MQMMKNMASEVLLELNCSDFPVHFSALEKYIERNGWLIATYSQFSKMLEGKKGELIRKVKAQMAVQNAFFCRFEGVPCIAYKEGLYDSVKRFAVAHEIAHVKLGHTPFDKNDAYEDDANLFAIYLLASPYILKQCRICSIAELQKLTGLDSTYCVMAWDCMGREDAFPSSIERDLLLRYTPFIERIATYRQILPESSKTPRLPIPEALPQKKNYAVPAAKLVFCAVLMVLLWHLSTKAASPRQYRATEQSVVDTPLQMPATYVVPAANTPPDVLPTQDKTKLTEKTINEMQISRLAYKTGLAN